MLHGTLWDKIPRFAVPVAATAILSQLFNAADIAVIGNFTGELRTVAVAAVGTNSSIISLIVNLFIGIALGANVTIAHAIGEKNDTMVHRAVHTSIVVAVLGGLIAAVIGELFAVPLLNQLNVPDDVFPLARTDRRCRSALTTRLVAHPARKCCREGHAYRGGDHLHGRSGALR